MAHLLTISREFARKELIDAVASAQCVHPMSVAYAESKQQTLVLVMKANAGAPAETIRLPGFELRREPDRCRVVLHRHGTDIASISTDELESWFVEAE